MIEIETIKDRLERRADHVLGDIVQDAGSDIDALYGVAVSVIASMIDLVPEAEEAFVLATYFPPDESTVKLLPGFRIVEGKLMYSAAWL